MQSKLGRRFWPHALLIGALAMAAAPGAFAAKRENASASPMPGLVGISLPTQPPAGAVVLYSGKEQDLKENWIERYTTNPAAWTVEKDGGTDTNGHDIVSKKEFGDFFIHAEFKCPVDKDGKPEGGNSGVGLQGRYEIQIDNSYGQQPSEGGCGALYSQLSPRVVASKKAGEWQTFDIVFRAPRLDGNGDVTEEPRVTVFQNGILIQNNESFRGPTGIQYGELHGQPKTGPIILQGDHNPVHFRNVWVLPM